MNQTALTPEQIRQMLAERIRAQNTQNNAQNNSKASSLSPPLAALPSSASAEALPKISAQILDPLHMPLPNNTPARLSVDPAQAQSHPKTPEAVAISGVGEDAARPTALQFSIKDLATLYISYIPLLKNGGIFVATSKKYLLGDRIHLSLNLPYSPDKHLLLCSVIWINPSSVSGSLSPGIGLAFPHSPEAEALNRQIVSMLSRLERVPPYTQTF